MACASINQLVSAPEIRMASSNSESGDFWIFSSAVGIISGSASKLAGADDTEVVVGKFRTLFTASANF